MGHWGTLVVKNSQELHIDYNGSFAHTLSKRYPTNATAATLYSQNCGRNVCMKRKGRREKLILEWLSCTLSATSI